MLLRHTHPDGVWVDLERPTEDELHFVAREFGISERIEAELISPSPSALAAFDGEVGVLILHFPAHDGSNAPHSQEIDFIVGRRFIITVRYEVVAPIREVQKLLETEELLSGASSLAPAVLLEVLFAHLYAAVRSYLENLASRLERVERLMFEGNERASVRALSDLSREFLHLEAFIAHQEEPLARFLRMLGERAFFGPSFEERAARLSAERLAALAAIRTHRAMASELRETNAALLGLRQNEVMKTLAVVNVIVLPLELIAFIFGMHALGTPLADNPNAFWIIAGSMAAIVLILTAYFVRKRWIF